MRIEFAEYLEQPSDSQHLSQKGIEFLTVRFNDLVEVYDAERTQQAIEKIASLSKDGYVRFWNIRRLPNVLLFGSDTLGPDLSEDFANLIEDLESREAFREAAQYQLRLRGPRGRSLNSEDLDMATLLCLSPDEIMHAYPPGAIDKVNCWLQPGDCVSSFFPEHFTSMYQRFKSNAYIAPSPLATRKIVVSWNMPLVIKDEQQM